MQKCVGSVTQPGSSLLCAGYCLYSSASVLVLTVGDGVYGFTLDPLVGEFILSHDRVQIPEVGKIYSFNEGNYQLWDDATKAYMGEWTRAPAYSLLCRRHCSGLHLYHRHCSEQYLYHRPHGRTS